MSREDWWVAARGDSLTPGRTERWALERFEVTRHEQLVGVINALRSGRGVTPVGEYTRLVRLTPGKLDSGVLVMSDTSDEIRDLAPLFWRAPTGRVLVNGLGMGCVVRGLLSRPEVAHVDVVEVDPEVIELVGGQITDPRVEVRLGDAFTYRWPPGTRWDCAWHDVWDTLSGRNLSGPSARPGSYEALNRRYGRMVDWQGAWGQDFLRRERRAR